MIWPLRERRAVVHRHDADRVFVAEYRHRTKAVPLAQCRHHPHEVGIVSGIELRPEHLALRDHEELREIHGVRSLAKDPALWAALSAVREKRAHVVKVVRGLVRGERLVRCERQAVAREDVADAAL
ncbi:MAG TPA: hypothetical protein VMS65_10375, partial [Polyangiaceae bacterium]|nr:hypothetical protein [Polyangiaceae bacterium]